MTRACFRCDGAALPQAWRRQQWDREIPIDHRGPNANLHLQREALTHALLKQVSDHAADFVRIAAFVYAADQSVSRGGDADIHGKSWYRHMALAIPVSDPDLWNAPEMVASLQDTLGFVSADNWEFSFSSADPEQDAIPLGSMDSKELLQRPDSVLLFSGGLDSLCMAVESVSVNGARPLLVSHTPDPAKASRQMRLAAALSARLPAWEFPHLVLRIHRMQSDPRDTSQRTRSFLFGSLGAAIAAELGITSVLLADNGVVSLNPPINDQLLGTLATRSTHPKFLAKFNRLLQFVFSGSVEVTNPLWARTRGEVARVLVHTGLQSLIPLTNSCAHAHRQPKEHPHCGVCSQCVDRRFAMIGEGLEEHDPVEGYGIDIFRQSLPTPQARTLAVSYYRWAIAIERTADDVMPDEFPQLYDAIVEDDPQPARTMLALIEMLRRHAANTIAVMKTELHRCADGLTHRRLPNDCLLRIALGPDAEMQSSQARDSDGLQPQSQDPSAEIDFQPSEDYRSVRWRGERYSLRAGQARAVEVLHQAYRQGTPELSQHTILERMGYASKRLDNVFRGSPLWGTLIKRGATQGTYRLCP